MSLYQFVFKQTLLSQEVRNIAYYENVGGTPTTANIQTAVDAMRTAWNNRLGTKLVNEWTLYGVDVRRVDIPGLLKEDYTFTSGVLTGTQTGDPAPTQVALVVSGKARTTKPNRLRNYFAGLSEASIDSGALFTQGAVDDSVLLMEDLDSIVGGPVTFERQCVTWNLSGTFVDAWNRCEVYFGNRIPATQRRRRIGRGI